MGTWNSRKATGPDSMRRSLKLGLLIYGGGELLEGNRERLVKGHEGPATLEAVASLARSQFWLGE